MADKKDEKKGGKKEEKKAPPGNLLEEFVLLFFIMFVVATLFFRAVSFFNPGGTEGIYSSTFEMITGGPNGWLATVIHYVDMIVSAYVTFATLFSMVTFLAIVYVAWLTYKLKVEENKRDALSPVAESKTSMQTQKWQQVLTHVNSLNPAEWRLAILEADVMLDDMMQVQGFHGDTLGERLKNTPRGDFKNIDAAWEAHKIRNAIAHEGSGFLLSQRESKRVISLYELVFKEFSYV